MIHQNDYCVILAGGIGRRLWPCSVKQKPKQFLDFFGTGRTLLQQTYDRFASFLPKDHIFISTFIDYKEWVRQQLPDFAEENILAEPVQLSTAPAVAWAACHIAHINPEANMIVSPTDQYIIHEEVFAHDVEKGFEFVDKHEGFLAFGVPATAPNTGYGYIQMGEEHEHTGYAHVKAFTEKPGIQFAQMFVESGEFLWNTGVFLWNLRTLLPRISQFSSAAPQLLEMEKSADFGPEQEAYWLERYYPSASYLSLDLCILERCSNVFVQKCDFGWADIGCWPELYVTEHKDADGNAAINHAQVMFSGSSDNLVCIPEDMVAVVQGLEGYLVAQQGKVLVICKNDDPARVRHMMNEAQLKLGDKFV